MRIIKEKFACPVCKKIFENKLLVSVNSECVDEAELFNKVNNIQQYCTDCKVKLVNEKYLKYFDKNGNFCINLQTIPISDKLFFKAYNNIAVEIYEIVQFLNWRNVEIASDIFIMTDGVKVNLKNIAKMAGGVLCINDKKVDGNNFHIECHLRISLSNGYSIKNECDSNSEIKDNNTVTDYTNNSVKMFDLIVVDDNICRDCDMENLENNLKLLIKKSQDLSSLLAENLLSIMNVKVCQKSNIFI